MVPYVYRRPFDYRAPDVTRRLLFPPQAAQVSTYRGPIRLIYSGGIFRPSYTVVQPQPLYQPAADTFGANSSLSFSATGTLNGSVDPTTAIIAYDRIAKERMRWYRERWDDTPVRLINPIFSSWVPTGEALLKFDCSGTMLAITAGQMSGATSLTFSGTANTNNVSLLSGQTTLRFNGVAVMPATALISGSTSLSFTLPPVNVPTLRGATSLSFSLSGYALQRVRRISMRLTQNRIEMIMADDIVNEGSTCSIVAAFFSASNAVLTPATARYRIKDVSNDRIVKDWTVVTPAHEIQIDISAQDNGIYGDGGRSFKRFEDRVVVVQANYDTDAQYTKETAYRIKNLRGFDS